MNFKVIAGFIGASAIALVAFVPSADAYPGQWRARYQWVADQLELSEDQRLELRELRQDIRADVEDVLTDEQETQLRQDIASGVGIRQAFTSLDLSDEQRDELRDILRSSRQEAMNVLSDEQRDELREMMQARFGSGVSEEQTFEDDAGNGISEQQTLENDEVLRFDEEGLIEE